jgi:hypothetical protein
LVLQFGSLCGVLDDLVLGYLCTITYTVDEAINILSEVFVLSRCDLCTWWTQTCVANPQHVSIVHVTFATQRGSQRRMILKPANCNCV